MYGARDCSTASKLGFLAATDSCNLCLRDKFAGLDTGPETVIRSFSSPVSGPFSNVLVPFVASFLVDHFACSMAPSLLAMLASSMIEKWLSKGSEGSAFSSSSSPSSSNAPSASAASAASSGSSTWSTSSAWSFSGSEGSPFGLSSEVVWWSSFLLLAVGGPCSSVRLFIRAK